MIAAAGIDDQEFSVTSERAGIDHPAIARRIDLRARTGRDRNALHAGAKTVVVAEAADDRAVDRLGEKALGIAEGDRRRQAVGTAE